jgi:hypothetical protein
MIQNHLLWTGEECKEFSPQAHVPDSISGDKNELQKYALQI